MEDVYLEKKIRIVFIAVYIVICLALSYVGIGRTWWVCLLLGPGPFALPRIIARSIQKRQNAKMLEEYYNEHPEARR